MLFLFYLINLILSAFCLTLRDDVSKICSERIEDRKYCLHLWFDLISVNALVLAREVCSSNLWPVKSNTELPTAHHRCNVYSKEPVLPGHSCAEMGPQIRYTLWRRRRSQEGAPPMAMPAMINLWEKGHCCFRFSWFVSVWSFFWSSHNFLNKIGPSIREGLFVFVTVWGLNNVSCGLGPSQSEIELPPQSKVLNRTVKTFFVVCPPPPPAEYSKYNERYDLKWKFCTWVNRKLFSNFFLFLVFTLLFYHELTKEIKLPKWPLSN